MSRGKWGYIFIFLFGIFLSIGTLAQAEVKEIPGNIKVGALEFHPGFAVKHEYTDNVFLEYKDERDSYLATLSPGLGIILPLGRHLLKAEYRADIMRYANFGSLLDTVDHSVNTLLNLDFPGGLGASLAYDYKRSSIPPYSIKEERKYFHDNNITTNVFYRFADRYKIELNYRHESRDFKKYMIWYPLINGVPTPFLQSDSYKKDDVSTALYYRILPKTLILFEFGYYHLNNVDPMGPSTDSKNYRVWFGLRWRPGGKLVGTIKGGYIARRYDVREGGHDIDDFGLFCDITYDFSPFDHFVLKGYREVAETYVSTKTTPYYGSNYIHSGFDLTYRHDFTRKLSGDLHVLYNNDNFTEKETRIFATGKERQDNRGGFGTSIDYQIREWLLCKLSYTYINNDSNFDVEDYRENRLMFFIATSF